MSYLDESSYLGNVSNAIGSEEPTVPSGAQANQLAGLGDTITLPGGIVIKRETLMLLLGIAAGALALYLYQRSKKN